MSRLERKAQTRERLLDAAEQVFAQRGFEAASIDEVAAAAGHTKGAVYSNFASKTDLFLALIERRIEVQSARLASAMDGQSPEAVLRRMQQATDRDPDQEQWLMLVAEFWLHAMRNPRARQALAEQYERARTISGGSIASSFAGVGQEPPLPARDLAIVIEALSVGLGFQAALDSGAVRAGLLPEVLMRLVHAPAPDPDTTSVPRAVPDPQATPSGRPASSELDAD